jgi:D-sedoheptulose 7-phosphate isomerase
VTNRNSNHQITEIIESHNKAVDQLQTSGLKTVFDIAEAITKAFKKGATVYICGNGGSAADAQHIASELVNRFESNRRALPAIALTTDSSIITSIANDSDYKAVFARQAEALVKKGDVFWAISTSGTSPNILSAVKIARQKKAAIIAFTGKKNTPLERLADICLCADNKITARTQEVHQLAYHIICKLIEQRF